VNAKGGRVFRDLLIRNDAGYAKSGPPPCGRFLEPRFPPKNRLDDGLQGWKRVPIALKTAKDMTAGAFAIQKRNRCAFKENFRPARQNQQRRSLCSAKMGDHRDDHRPEGDAGVQTDVVPAASSQKLSQLKLEISERTSNADSGVSSQKPHTGSAGAITWPVHYKNLAKYSPSGTGKRVVVTGQRWRRTCTCNGEVWEDSRSCRRRDRSVWKGNGADGITDASG